jgi:hypothetical protein
MNLHKKGNPALFVKLDISKAFDTLNWAYLLDVLRACGFSLKWHNWVVDILRSSSSRIIINGQRSNAIKHRRGCDKETRYPPFFSF